MSKPIILAWWSAGITSAVACKITLEQYRHTHDVKLFYFDTGQVHPDNDRFKKECEQWYDHEIITRKNKTYSDPFDVYRRTRYVNGPAGAACTSKLKKNVRYDIQDEFPNYVAQVFGFEFSKKEINRAIRFLEQYPEAKPTFPLIEKGMTKDNCAALISQAGIEIPAMYKLGYPNNNCIGCVKGGAGYWNKIRQDFPEIFTEMAQVEREVGATALKDKDGKIYLDELDPERGRNQKMVMPDCGSFCDLEFEEIEDKKTGDIYMGEMTIDQLYEHKDNL